MYPQEREDNKDNRIVVRMLGGFTVTYKGQEIALGRNSSARFVQLLQLVWLQGRRGITKEKLVEALYDRVEISNVNSSFNTLVYRMRIQMQNAGLPEGEYVVWRNGLYVPDENVPVWIDAQEFEALMEQAEQTADPEQKAACCRAAFDLYQGDLLSDVSGQLWVLESGIKYKKMFSKCVLWLGEYARAGRDYLTMETVYGKAAGLYPLEEWESGLMDALLAQSKYKRALELYNKTVRLYSDELGLPPPERMLEAYKRLSEKLVHCPGTMDEIVGMLREPMDDYDKAGAYYCSYPSFIDAYRLLSRNMERSGISMYLMMCTLADYEGRALQNEEKLKEQSEALCQAIRVSLRQGDIFTKYSISQYLILVMNIRDEDCGVVARRITGKLRALTTSRAELLCQVRSVARVS